MDVIKKKHWWQSDALKWSVLGLLGLLVGTHKGNTCSPLPR